MINCCQEIENCLKTLENTNNKEQNFQGILFQYFREKFMSLGYIVEMETSVLDEHIKTYVCNKLGISPNSCHDDIKSQFRKSEMDLLIYKTDLSELYAAELKWIYHRDTGWNVLDHLKDFQDDVSFCKELKDKLLFTKTCSVVVHDFDKNKLVQSPRISDSKENAANVKYDFLGGSYSLLPSNGKICNIPFEWKNLPKNAYQNQNNRYYIIQFN